MKRLEFPADLACGVATVDAQHRTLYVWGERVLAAADGDLENVRAAVRYLAEYAEYHFCAEERVMERIGYDRSYVHRRQHEHFRAELDDVAVRIEREGVTRALEVRLHFVLTDWFAHHVEHVDRRLIRRVRESEPAVLAALERELRAEVEPVPPSLEPRAARAG